MSTHMHQCGVTAIGALDGFGCGHVWSHEDRSDWYLADHYCPECGRGPFTFQVALKVDWRDAFTVTQEEYPDPRSDDIGGIVVNE